MSSLQLDAEALFEDLLRHVRGLLRPNTALLGIDPVMLSADAGHA